jgi:hypothetical protein
MPENNQNSDRKTLVVEQRTEDYSKTIINWYLPRLRSEVTCENYGAVAANRIMSKKFSLIVLPLKVAPGYELKAFMDFQSLKKFGALI